VTSTVLVRGASIQKWRGSGEEIFSHTVEQHRSGGGGGEGSSDRRYCRSRVLETKRGDGDSEVSTHDEPYRWSYSISLVSTFRAITSDWSKHTGKDSLGTQNVILISPPHVQVAATGSLRAMIAINMITLFI
jgi:hypothetical protein